MTRTLTQLYNSWKFTDRDVEGGHLPECPAGDWSEITLPHDWAVTRPDNPAMRQGAEQGYLDRWGVGWYRYDLTLETKVLDYRYLLVFDGVFEKSQVWLNGEPVSSKRYGYSGFTLDVTTTIVEGGNLLAVRVDNRDGITDRWYSGAGIYRKVTLLTVHRLHLLAEDIVTKTAFSGEDALLTAETAIHSGTVRAVLTCGDEPIAKAAAEDGVLTLKVPGVRRWSAEFPQLYTLTLRLYEQDEMRDELILPIGFREVDFVSQEGLFVNGNPVKLKGVCLHHDAGCVGTAVTKSLWRQRLTLLKKLGCNAIRTSHNIPSPELLDLCDELGFYVVEESFDKWVSGSYGRFFDEDWETDISFMVRRDRNRPCVIMWSVGNEAEGQGSQSMTDILVKLVTQVKTLESTRPVTCALMPHYFDDNHEEVMGIESFLPYIRRIADQVDVISLNYHEQWYEDIHAACPDKLILASESYLYFQGSHSNIFSFSAENPWIVNNKHNYAIGSFLWAGIDYLGESMGFPSRGWCGCMIRSNLEPRPIAHLFESYWSDTPMVHITMLDYSLQDEYTREQWAFPPMLDSWNFPMYRRMPVPYMIFTNCEDVKLTLNGKPLDTKRPSECESGIITGYALLESGVIRAEGFMDGKAVCCHELQSAGEAAKLEFMEREITLDDDCPVRQVLLTVHAKDRDGMRCMRESGIVRLQVEGDGVLEGVDNGSMTCGVRFSEDRAPMFQGSASTVIRTTAASGRIVIRAYGDGLFGDTAIIQLR